MIDSQQQHGVPRRGISQYHPRAHFGLVYPYPDPKNPTAIPNYAALIRKKDQGQLHVDYVNWFGKFVLPADAKNDDIIRISRSRLARIALLPPTCV